MATDHIRYDLLAQDALRGVVGKVLTDVAHEHGLPGDRSFLRRLFDPRAAGREAVADRLLATISGRDDGVLQHQFWDLVVTDDRFEVGLSFGGIPERVVVPFDAIKGFFDPSVQFGLTFEPSDAVPETPATNLPAVPAPAVPPVAAPAAENQDEPTKPSEGAEVVRLDRFRKK